VQFILKYGYGDIFSRNNLTKKYRQIATIIALIAMSNAQAQLRFHINAELNIGISAEEIKEVMLLMTMLSLTNYSYHLKEEDFHAFC